MVFPGEPILTVKAPVMEAQLVETAILNILNHQTLIATKAAKVCYAAKGDAVMEFGLRRAQGPDAGIYGSRASVIGGCGSTSNVLAGQLFDIPVAGTHAHSWVMNFPSEYEAFRAYAETYPDNALLLVDTYDTLGSGVPNAIRVFREMREKGLKPKGIRLDSGDIAYLTREARQMLDEAGWESCKISASNSLDEYIIQDILRQGAKVDLFGVGERMITSKSDPVFGGVYKLAAIEKEDGTIVPKIKISENVGKITNPHFKKVYRIFDKATGKAEADYITVWDEVIEEGQPLELFDPDATWKRRTYTDYTIKPLQEKIFEHGQLVYQQPTLPEIQKYCREQIDTLWDEVKRFENPHNYYVDLSQKLWDIKQDLLRKNYR